MVQFARIEEELPLTLIPTTLHLALTVEVASEAVEPVHQKAPLPPAFTFFKFVAGTKNFCFHVAQLGDR